MKRGAADHPKTLMLAVRLGIEKYTAVGILECLLHWAYLYAPQGDIGKWPNGVIADGIGWKGDPDDLIAALLEHQWFDPVDGPARFVIHDIQEHADDTWRKNLENKGLVWWDGSPTRKYTKGETQDKREAFDKSSTKVRQKFDKKSPTLPYHTIPNHTKENTQASPGVADSRKPESVESREPESDPDSVPEPKPPERQFEATPEERALAQSWHEERRRWSEDHAPGAYLPPKAIPEKDLRACRTILNGLRKRSKRDPLEHAQDFIRWLYRIRGDFWPQNLCTLQSLAKKIFTGKSYVEYAQWRAQEDRRQPARASPVATIKPQESKPEPFDSTGMTREEMLAEIDRRKAERDRLRSAG